MKRNKNIKILIILLCIIMTVILACLIYIFFSINHPTSTNVNHLENTQQNESNIPTGSENNIFENEEQQNIVEPILNEITNSQNNQTNQEVISATYYYGQLDNNAKIIYNSLKENIN